MAKRKPEPAKHDGMQDCSELMFLARRLSELYAEIKLIDEEGHIIKTGNELEDKRLQKAGFELWEQYEAVQEFMPFVFPYDTRDCLILIIQAVFFAETMRHDVDDEQKSHNYKRAESLLDRTLARLLTGMSQLVDDKLSDLGLQGDDFLENIDQNKLAVSIVNEIRMKQFAEAEKAGIVDVCKASGFIDGRAEMQGPPPNGMNPDA